MNGKIQAKNALNFILAGKATVTFVSKATGTRFTYKVGRKDQTQPHFVRLLTGPDNTRNYSYMGRIVAGSQYIHDRRNRAGAEDTPAAKGFRWVLYKLVAGEFDLVDSSVEIWHAGKCGCCGRTLTVPESIETGIGPVCAGKPQAATRNHNRIVNAKPIQVKAKSHKVGTIRQVETGFEVDVVSGYSGKIYTVQVAGDGSAVCNCEWADYRPGEDKRTGCSHSIAALDAVEEIVANRKLSVWTKDEDADRQHRPTRQIGDGVVLTSRLLDRARENEAWERRMETAGSMTQAELDLRWKQRFAAREARLEREAEERKWEAKQAMESMPETRMVDKLAARAG